MSTITNYVDLSVNSLAIAGIVFFTVVFITKYAFDSYSSNTKEEEKRNVYLTLLYCVLIGLVCAALTLVLCKQFCKFGTSDILTDPFPSKN